MYLSTLIMSTKYIDAVQHKTSVAIYKRNDHKVNFLK